MTDLAGATLVSRVLDQLADGTIGWVVRNLDHFDPFSVSAQSGAGRQMKATLELALFSHYAARLESCDARLDKITALLRSIWSNPGLPGLIAASPPSRARQYALICVALAPSGASAEPLAARAAELRASGQLAAGEKSPYLRLETRFYADKAGIAHDLGSYRELTEKSILVDQPAAFPLSIEEAYTLTHTSFYISDFGRNMPWLPASSRGPAADLVRRMLDHCVATSQWDLTAELLLTQACLGIGLASSESAIAAMSSLVTAQLPDGAIPGRSAAERATAAAGTVEFFAKAYHTTLAAALMSLIISSGGEPRPSQEDG